MRLNLMLAKACAILVGALSITVGPAALAQHPAIGVNLTSDNLFADAMRLASPHWDSPTNFGDSAASEDANGWPTQDASIMVWAGRQYNEGTYTLDFNGIATVNASYGYASISPQNPNGTTGNYDSVSNTTTATVVVSPGFQNFSLIFTNTKRDSSGSSAGVTNVRLYRPVGNAGTTSYPSGTTFTNDVKNLAAKFSVIRFMDLADTNNTNQTNWSDRKLPGTESQNQPIAWEYMVQLCNETGDDLYLNIPILATNAYVTNLANLVAYGSDGVNPYTSPQSNPAFAPLNSNLHVYIEFSNEVWNFGTNAAINLQSRAVNDIVTKNAEYSIVNFDGLDVSGPNSSGVYNNQYTLMWRIEAERLKETSDIFRSVFGDGAMPPNQNPRIRPILEYQYDNDQNTAITELSFLDNYYDNGDGLTHTSNPQPVYYYLWGGGGASYFGSNNDNATTIDGIFASGIPSSGYADTIQGEAVWSKAFGLKTIAYEGGWSVQASGGNGYENAAGSPAAESKYDSRASQAEIDAQTIFSQQGGDVNVHYTASSFDHNYVWGMTDNIENLADPIYLGIDSISASTQAATTAGTTIPGDVPAGAYHGSTTPTSTEVDFVRNGWSNNYIVEAPSAGNYTLIINFDSGNSAPNIVRVLVNGDATTYNLTGIGYGPTLAVDSSPATIHLNAGFNGIRIVAISADINLHLLRFSSGGGTGNNGPASTPAFSPGGGTYTSTQRVSISDSTSGSTIYYTTNGTTPTTSSSVYSGPITVSSTETLQAIATASGYTTSSTASATYTISSGSGGSESPFKGPHNIPGKVEAEDYDTGGQGVGYNQINGGGGSGYRTDNNTAVEANSADSNGYDLGWTTAGQWTKYTVVAANAGTYTVSFVVASPGGQTDAFHLQNAAGTNLSGNINVPSTGGWYTWQSVTATVTLLAGTQTLEIAQDNSGWNLDDFSFAAQSGGTGGSTPASTPTFSPAGGTYTSTQSVSIADSTSGATIYFTTNGTTPTTSSTVYSGPITVSSTETIQAIATASGFTTSAVASATYTINSSTGGGGGGGNIATTGTGYRWAGMSSSTANSGSVAATGVNDGNTTTTFALNNGNDDAANAWEAAGVTWSATQSSVSKVVFYQGTTDTDPNYGNGWFQAGFALQISTDGSTWSNAGGWTLSPAYTAGPGASGVAYTFTTSSPVSVKGIRVVGQVHTGGTGSYDAYAAELQVFTSGGGSSQTQVPLGSAANLTGLYTDGTSFSGGLDRQGYAYSGTLLGSSLTLGSTKFNFGSSNANDVVVGGSASTIALPAGNFSTLSFLGTAVNGSQQAQIFTVTYTDGTSTQFTQSLSDWFSPQSYSGESVADPMAYRDASNGTKDNRTFNLYEYSLSLNNAKTVQSITLPNNQNVVVAAVTLLP